jgi:hypothetical protein
MSTYIGQSGKGEPTYAVPANNRDKPKPPFYLPTVGNLVCPQLASLLTSYSHIPPEKIPEHVQRIRDEAWEIRQYPCIGLGAYLQAPLLSKHDFYPKLVQHLANDKDALFIDVGTFLGVDLRFLWKDLLKEQSIGADQSTLASKIKAIDLVDFWPLSFQMFNDNAQSFPVEFMLGDALSPTSGGTFASLKSRVSVINIAQVLHQFNLEGCTTACITLASYYSRPGTVIIGNQIGTSVGKVFTAGVAKTYQHGPDSWKEMWKQVGKATGTKWEVSAELKSFAECDHDGYPTGWLGEGAGFLFWECHRLE